MKHMLGDYYSRVDPIPALIISAVLILVFLIIVFVQMHKEAVKKAEAENTPPTKMRATYLAAVKSADMYQARVHAQNKNQEVDNAITRTRP